MSAVLLAAYAFNSFILHVYLWSLSHMSIINFIISYDWEHSLGINIILVSLRTLKKGIVSPGTVNYIYYFKILAYQIVSSCG